MLDNFTKIFASVLTGKENLNKSEIQVCCPFHNDSNPSLCINIDTGLWVCQGCGEKGSAMGFWMKLYNVDYKTALKELGEFDEDYQRKPKIIIEKEKPVHIDDDYTDYVLKSIKNVHDNYEFFFKKLYELRGLTMPTAISCSIGYEHAKGWIFPIMRYEDGSKAKIVGYEVRQKEFKKFNSGNKCYKATNSPSCLSVVYSGWEKKRCWICEGFVDSYFLYQHLYESTIKKYAGSKKINDWILTPSMGVKTVPTLIRELELWKDFEEIIFVLDNDIAGNSTYEEIEKIEHRNCNFIKFSGLEENEDFEMWYKRGLNQCN